MRTEQGMTLVELLTVLAVGSALAVTAVGYSVSWLARESLRGAMSDAQAVMQLAKMEAASRNRPCRVVLNAETGVLRVWDTRATPSVIDDTLLHERRIPDAVGFARPDGGSVITLPQIGSSASFQTVFTSQGLAEGAGDVFLFGGDRYGRVSVHAAGGVALALWNGAQWRAGG